jgi:hypothetical protein
VGRQYYERKRREGKTPKEALRCLKRRLSDLACYQLLAGQHGTIKACGSPTTPPPTRPASTSPATRSHRAAPPCKPHAARYQRVHRARLERRPPRRHRDHRRQHPPPPRPPRPSRNHRPKRHPLDRRSRSACLPALRDYRWSSQCVKASCPGPPSFPSGHGPDDLACDLDGGVVKCGNTILVATGTSAATLLALPAGVRAT